MKLEEIHIGEEIRKKVQDIGLSDAEFGRRINTSRQNAQSIYERKSVDILLLSKICKALDFDFLSFYKDDKEQKSIDNLPKKKAKVVIELELNDDDILKLGLKDKVLQILK